MSDRHLEVAPSTSDVNTLIEELEAEFAVQPAKAQQPLSAGDCTNNCTFAGCTGTCTYGNC